MDLLLDTNILIDHFGNRPGFAESAHKVMAMGVFGDAALWTTSNSLVDAFYLLRKAVDPHQVQEAFSKGLAHISICSAGQEDVLRALGLSWTDLEDCLVAICADKVRADFIVTRDKHGFTQSPIPAISPDELLNLMSSTYGLSYEFDE